ncbi:MAG: leucyl aminopeptidase [Pseudonocardiales bacterium]|jgi:leucyl aminopeptidase|nr:leucyl aminopeptidase [Pseudonocardiales bacterium]
MPAGAAPSPAVSFVDPADPVAADAVVVGVRPGSGRRRFANGGAAIDAAFGGRLAAALDALGAKGKAGEVLRIPTLGLAPFPLIVTTGLGADDSAESIRRAVGAAIRSVGEARTVHVAIEGAIGAVTDGVLLGNYAFTAYKSFPAKRTLRRVTVPAMADASGRAELRRSRVLGEAVNVTRDLVNTPPNDLYPETFAARVSDLAATQRLDVEVLGPRELARGGFGGIVAVGSGSARPPRLVRVTYRPARPVARVALVGKGVTFDSGGLNLKTAHLTWMKSDMGGGAAVVASTVAAAALRLPVEVTATVPMVENMPSGSAYRPSDILTMRNGKTVEVADTDAEGRLILGDAISRALEDEPDRLIEASTLTGGQLVALGTRVIGAMGEPAFRDLVAETGTAAGESVWAMPLPDDLRPGLDSPVADLSNLPEDRWGSMLVAGMFLKEFMSDDVPWVHLDIAGPAWNMGGPRDYTPKGGTGAAVRTIVATLGRLAQREA